MKKLTFSILAFAVAAGCSDSDDIEDVTVLPPSADVTTSQVQAWRSLEASTSDSWTWLQHAELKTPMHLETTRTGRSILKDGSDVVHETLTVLDENKALFRMRAPALELGIEHALVDDLGMTHARFQQMTHGVPVVGAELMAHYDESGRLASIDANYVSDLDGVDVNPTIAVDDARARVTADVLRHSVIDETALDSDDGKLVVEVRRESGTTAARLAYRFKVRAMAAKEPAIWVVTVDAKTGEIIHRYNDLQTVQAQGVGVLGDRKQFEVASTGAGFVMIDATLGVPVRTYTASQSQITPGMQVSSSNVASWDTGVPGAGAAVDAHVHATKVLTYYKEKHGRNAIDGVGGALVSTAHFGTAYDNAAWDSTGMIYGDGGDFFRALSVSLDVVGHEFTHGVTEKTSQLVYEGQAGALNEAVSDIFGAFIEHAEKPDATKNWVTGEEVVKQGVPLRDMRHPEIGADPQPSHMTTFVVTQQDNGGVHINSGIINNAAYLMTVGGVNPVSKMEVKYGIGWEKSEKLWYRANTKYFLQTTNFGQAAQGVLQSAKDIGLTANETNIVICAFKATGLVQGKCATLTNPQSTSTSSGDDSDDAETTTTTKKKKRTTVMQQSTSGCRATRGSTDVGTSSLAVLASVLGVAMSRRKKRAGAG